MNPFEFRFAPVWAAETETGGSETPSAAGAEAATGPSPEAKAASAPADLIAGAGGEAKAEPAAQWTDWTPEAVTEVLPKGYEVTPEQSTRLQEIVNAGKGDTKAVVSGLLSYYTELAESAKTEFAAEFETLQTRMQDEFKADPQIGGKNLEESLRVSREVAERFGGQELLDLFRATGAGNSVHMARFLLAVAKAVPAEGKPVNGAPSAAPKTLGQRMFPNS